MQYVSSQDFACCSSCVEDTFIRKKTELKQKLSEYDLDVFFLSDSSRRGVGTIRAYIQSFDFEKFSKEDRLAGGSYFASCQLFKVSNVCL